MRRLPRCLFERSERVGEAEEAAESARAFARKVAQEERREEADTFDWEEELGNISLDEIRCTCCIEA